MARLVKRIESVLVVLGLCVFIGQARAQESLLRVSAGQLPSDTGLEDASELSIEEGPEGFGGQVLRVVFAAGDSFGASRQLNVRDWSRFSQLEFSVFNPSDQASTLTLVIRHEESRSFDRRIDLPLKCRAGLNEFRIRLEELQNNDGSLPQLAKVTQWYITAPEFDEDGPSPTFYFSDFSLTLNDEERVVDRVGIRIDPARLERIRQTEMPAFDEPVRFDTTEADRIISALEVFPPDHPFNQLVDQWPVHPRSDAIVASIGVDKPFRYNADMAYVIVPPDQPRVEVQIVEYPDESDAGPFPIPEIIPIEGWPEGYRQAGQQRLRLEQVQRRPADYEGDRHAIVVDPVNRKLYEFFTFGKTGTGWAAGQASVFDLSSNQLRPDGWTSADAAGLPIFPAVVRYDELERGVIDHAMRVTVSRSRRAYVYPATHFASRLNDEDLPRMGERLRLKADFDTSRFSPEVRTILIGLQRYGMLVADNGIDWAISVAPDPRIPELHEELRSIRGSDFEVVVAPE